MALQSKILLSQTSILPNKYFMAKKPTFAEIGKETDRINVRLSYKIVELFSEGLYASPNKAIEELVANAFDAGALDVQVLISDNLSEQNATIVVIDDGEGRDDHVRDALWCAFSRLIITKQAGASLAMDLSHSRPHKVFDRAPIKPFKKFLVAVHHVLKNCICSDQRDRGPATRVSLGDARRLPIATGSIDLVLTSPPYLNAIDYLRCSKFSLVWMGYTVGELEDIRTESVGTESGDQEAYENEDIKKIIAELKLSPKLPVRNEAILAHYIKDMHLAVEEAVRVLSPEGRAVYVVGENTVRGTFIPNAKIVSAVAELSGLTIERRRARVLPANRRYLPPPTVRNSSEGLEGRMRR